MDVEQKLIASMILDDGCIQHVAKVVSARDLLEPNRHLYQALVSLHERGVQVSSGDIESLIGHLRDEGLLERIGGMRYLVEVIQSQVSAALALQYAKEVRLASLDRQLRQEVAALSVTDSMDAAFVACRAEHLQRIADEQMRVSGKTASRQRPAELCRITDVLPAVTEHLHATLGRTGWPTSLSSLTELLGGWRPGETTILVGHTGSGKTLISLQEALYQRIQEGRRVLHWPIEGGWYQVFPKLCRHLTGKDARTLNADTHRQVVDMVGDKDWLTTSHIGVMEPDKLARLFEYSLEVDAPEFAVIDHLHQLVQPTDRQLLEKLAEHTMNIVNLTARSRCHTILVAQARQNPAGSDDWIPGIYDIKGLTTGPQGAANVISICRFRGDPLAERKPSYRAGDRMPPPEPDQDGMLPAAMAVRKCRDAAGTEGFFPLRYQRQWERYLVDPRHKVRK